MSEIDFVLEIECKAKAVERQLDVLKQAQTLGALFDLETAVHELMATVGERNNDNA